VSAAARAAGALEIHQFVPILQPWDAVGNHVLESRQALRRSGLDGAIWAAGIHPQFGGTARPYRRFARSRSRGSGKRLLLYQAASWSCGIVDFLLDRPETKVLSYHNFTPPEYFDPYDAAVASSLRQAIAETRTLAAKVKVALAASEFNAVDLREMGIPSVHVVPPFLPPNISAQPDPRTLAELTAGRTGLHLLFVGRLTPHKGHVQLVRLLAMVRAAIDPGARLFLVGSKGPAIYMHLLARHIDRLTPGAVVLTGPVSDAQLAAYYAQADMFVCLSEHEGFGLPLIEAMLAQVPVIAYDAGAVGETVGGAGVLVRTLEPAVLAEVVARVAVDKRLQAELRHRQTLRAAQLEAFPREQALISALSEAASA